MQMLSKSLLSLVLITLSTLFVSGCATQVTEEPSKITRSDIPFGQFDKVVLVKAEIAEEFAGHGANVKAANKIDEILAQKLSAQFGDFSVMTLEEAQQMFPGNTSNDNTLIIKPLIKQIKFIGGAARFWAGAMAGSSVVIMDTAFIDGNSGRVLSNPGYYRKAGAYTDIVGVASNEMLEDIAVDVANYTRTNF